MFKDIQEATQYIQNNQIRYVDLKLVDLRGRFRHITIPAERLSEKTMKDGIGFDASNYGYASVEKSDMVFYPDLSSAVMDPFAEEATLTMFGDVYVIRENENVPFAQYPRNIVHSAVDFMRKEEIADEMIIGPEYEFSVFDSMSYRIASDEVSYRLRSEESEWSSDDEFSNGFHTLPKGGYHADRPSDIRFDLRNQICSRMKEYGIDVKYHHHEVGGSGQMEIEVELEDMIRLADDTMNAKYLIRTVAAENGLSATLLPKPIASEAGNGMHVHMLLRKDGKNLFYEKGNYANLSKTAMYFIGGLLTHIRSLCAFANPTTNSYRRLVPGFEAPVTIGYASANRSAVIRIPSYAKSEDTVRFELRNPDATCNPYLTFAAILMAGLDGIINHIDPAEHNWGPFDFNLYHLSEEEKAKLEHLPASVEEALRALEEDHDYLLRGSVFPKELIVNWIRAVRKDVSEVEKIPHPAEFRLYYDL
ncbi:MAG: type I glutamate--ammonia ligase [Erysipelotrichaceae bacterium]|nr:type I glutamate--ammonia ligase [Erysipelotrichaceae bacterium]